MKKILALVLALAMVLSLAACGKKQTAEETTTTAEETTTTTAAEEETTTTAEETEIELDFGAMSYDEYCAAEMNDEVTVFCYVQATQSWWDNKITVYAADKDGAYFIYEMACEEEEAASLVPGACIIVSGYKSEWSGEVEIVDASFILVEGLDTYVAEAVDATEALASEDELLALQNQLVAFNEMAVESVAFKNDEPGDDIYVTLSKNGKKFDFCLEYYLNGSDEEFYNTVSGLKKGQIVDVEGFLYWYNGMNPHLTKVTVKDDVTVKSEGVMTYEEYAAAAVDDEVVIEAYVQDAQSWWDNKITVYAADADGAYFLYEAACSEEDAAKVVPGQKIKVTGFKSEWSGEVEIVDAEIEFLDAPAYIAAPVDVTEAEDLTVFMNQKVLFTDMTVDAVAYKNDEPGDDIYVTFSKDGVKYEFCLEYYLNGDDEEFYNMIGGLEEGTVVDVEGFLYWYNGPNAHITAVTAK